jgi:hypothetical protein
MEIKLYVQAGPFLSFDMAPPVSFIEFEAPKKCCHPTMRP